MATAGPVTPEAKIIGKTITKARLAAGYDNRVDLVETRVLRGKLTSEGLRKIEDALRTPRVETVQNLCRALSIPAKTEKHLKRLAVQAAVKRAARRAGNIDVKVKVGGQALALWHLPPTKKIERFVRDVVTDVTRLMDRIGIPDQDIDFVRKSTRGILHAHLRRERHSAAKKDHTDATGVRPEGAGQGLRGEQAMAPEAVH